MLITNFNILKLLIVSCTIQSIKIFLNRLFDVIFINESNEISEGAITNIFIHNNDIISTPHTNAGILPGVYRKHLLKNNSMIRERRIYLKDLIEADKIVLTNSVRGEIEVGKLYLNESEFMEYK